MVKWNNIWLNWTEYIQCMIHTLIIKAFMWSGKRHKQPLTNSVFLGWQTPNVPARGAVCSLFTKWLEWIPASECVNQMCYCCSGLTSNPLAASHLETNWKKHATPYWLVFTWTFSMIKSTNGFNESCWSYENKYINQTLL